MANGVKFIRKGGRVIPIRESSGATANSKKKYPAVKRVSETTSALYGAGVAALFARSGSGIIIPAAMGALSYGAMRNIAYSKKAKGESDKHLGQRVANAMNAKKSKK